MKNTLKEILKITVLGSALVVVQAFAFSEPGTSAPGGSAVAPINVGNVMQTKDGVLRAQMLRSFSDAFFATDVGNVGIGTMSPAQKLDVVGGQIHATGDICTDAGGGKCLSTAGGGGGDTTPDTIADDGVISDAEASDALTINNGLLYAPTSGNVGVGTTS